MRWREMADVLDLDKGTSGLLTAIRDLGNERLNCIYPIGQVDPPIPSSLTNQPNTAMIRRIFRQLVLLSAANSLGEINVLRNLCSGINVQTRNLTEVVAVSNTKNGTDTGLYSEGLYEGDILINEGDTRNAIFGQNKLWPNGFVIFKIAEDVGCPTSFQCKIVMKAMDVYHNSTCLRFKEWTGEQDFVEIFYNKDNSGACWSLVGRSGGEQRLSLGHRCWYLGIVVHELGHAIGFWHEMNRPERDTKIIVHWRNILSGYSSAFKKNAPSTVNNLGEPFDLKSIMMYDEYAFSKDGVSPTIETISGDRIGPIWQKTGLSESDVRRVNKLYQCQGTGAKIEQRFRFECNFSAHTCGFKNIKKQLWKRKTISSSEGYIYTTDKNSGSPNNLVSANFHGIGNNLYAAGCMKFCYLISAEGALMIKQEILNAATDLTTYSTRILWSMNHTTSDWACTRIKISLAEPFRIGVASTFNKKGIIALKSIKIASIVC